MFLLICKFRSHLDQNQQMYFNYGIAISNIVEARTFFLRQNNLSIVNNTIFTEFKISCIGSTVDYIRMSRIRYLDNYMRGIIPFKYNPQTFFQQPKEKQIKFDPSKKKFRNSSGNKIFKSKNFIFDVVDGLLFTKKIENESQQENDAAGSDESRITPHPHPLQDSNENESGL